MATEADLLLAVKDLLRSSGHLNKLQAQVRTHITHALSDRSDSAVEAPAKPPTASPQTALVNELVREYLEWSGYLYTASVLASEVGLAGERRTRAEICTEVGVKDDQRSSTLPLLTSIVAAYTERVRRKISRAHK